MTNCTYCDQPAPKTFSVICEDCGMPFCQSCALVHMIECTGCGKIICTSCMFLDGTCEECAEKKKEKIPTVLLCEVCAEEAGKYRCALCGALACKYCIRECNACGTHVCMDCDCCCPL